MEDSYNFKNPNEYGHPKDTLSPDEAEFSDLAHQEEREADLKASMSSKKFVELMVRRSLINVNAAFPASKSYSQLQYLSAAKRQDFYDKNPDL